MEQAVTKNGFVKVKLTYKSAKPHTEAALVLKQLKVGGPYLEEIRVLVPCERAFSDLAAYTPAFRLLKQHAILPSDAELLDYVFDDENEDVVAYVFRPATSSWLPRAV